MKSNLYKHLNIDHLNEYFLGDPNVIKDLLNIYIPSVQSDLSLLEIAIEKEDVASIAKFAHKLKSAFRYLGVISAGEIFEKIERIAKNEVNFTQINLLFQMGLRMNIEINKDINQFLNQ